MTYEQARRLAAAITRRDATALGMTRLLLGAGDAADPPVPVRDAMRIMGREYASAVDEIAEILNAS